MVSKRIPLVFFSHCLACLNCIQRVLLYSFSRLYYAVYLLSYCTLFVNTGLPNNKVISSTQLRHLKCNLTTAFCHFGASLDPAVALAQPLLPADCAAVREARYEPPAVSHQPTEGQHHPAAAAHTRGRRVLHVLAGRS